MGLLCSLKIMTDDFWEDEPGEPVSFMVGDKIVKGRAKNFRSAHGEWVCDVCLKDSRLWLIETPVDGLVMDR